MGRQDDASRPYGRVAWRDEPGTVRALQAGRRANHSWYFLAISVETGLVRRCGRRAQKNSFYQQHQPDRRHQVVQLKEFTFVLSEIMLPYACLASAGGRIAIVTTRGVGCGGREVS